MASLPQEILCHSISDAELILPFGPALEAVKTLNGLGCHVLGWEGWLRYADGSVSPSVQHQGTMDLDELTAEEAANFISDTIRDSRDQWLQEPEAEDAELYFCISFSSDS